MPACVALDLPYGQPQRVIAGAQSNFIGTEFVAYDRGERSLKKAQQRAASARFVPALAPEAAPSVSEAGSGGSDGGAVSARSERVVVQYHMNVLGTKGPRKMTIGIPYVDFDTNEAVVWSGTSAQDGMLARCARRASLASACPQCCVI